MERLGLKSNRKGRNREASERKGRAKGRKNGEKRLPTMGATIFFRFAPSISTLSLRLSSVFRIFDSEKRLFYHPQSAMLFIQNTCDFFGIRFDRFACYQDKSGRPNIQMFV